MKCALCKDKEANKTNTHYLTDGIIRKCLNFDGSNEREKGYYFDISNTSPFVEFNFQRLTPILQLEADLGRQPTEEEIEKAKEIPFSVDYVFCDRCESKFTEIESKFIGDILPKFRESDLTGTHELLFDDVKLCRLFFLIQVWRACVCEESFVLTNETFEALRLSIFNSDVKNIHSMPLSISYLETKGGDFEYTFNYVGFTDDANPNIILFNDFVIHFFESMERARFIDLFGLHTEDSMNSSINCNEDKFKVVIKTDVERKEYLRNYAANEKAKESLEAFIH